MSGGCDDAVGSRDGKDDSFGWSERAVEDEAAGAAANMNGCDLKFNQ